MVFVIYEVYIGDGSVKFLNVYIQHDYKTSERAGAGGMFQVVACRGEKEDGHVIDLPVDVGLHFHTNQDVLKYLVDKFPEYDLSSVNLEDDD